MFSNLSRRIHSNHKYKFQVRSFSQLNEVQLHITDAAKKKLGEMKNVNQKNSFIRIIVDSGGCKGYLVKFEIDDNDLAEDDHAYFHNEKPKLVIDKLSLDLLGGSTIDYVNEIARQSFVIADNPNAGSSCGCKVSFSKE
jgi:iron-sulfur cluster assembly accessory protein